MRVIYLIVLLFSLCPSRGQSVEELRRQAQELELKNKSINHLINSNQNKQKSAAQNLKLTNQKIVNRGKIIKNLDSQIDVLERELGESGSEIIVLNGNLERLKGFYAALVNLAYLRHKGRTIVTFLASDELFAKNNRALATSLSLAELCHKKAYEIDTLRFSINNRVEMLTVQKGDLEKLLNDKSREIKLLEKEKGQFAALNKDLESKNSKLREEVQNNSKQLVALQRQIEKIIAEVSISSGGEINKVLSAKFDENRGRLPAPVRGGVVVDKFGLHNHPTEKGVKINNNGVNIAAAAGEAVCAIFEGEVKRIFYVPGMGNSIIVRHGKYLTVYSNLEAVSVKQGESVAVGQRIGALTKNDPTLHFEVWNETEKLNPEEWIAI